MFDAAHLKPVKHRAKKEEQHTAHESRGGGKPKAKAGDECREISGLI
jgi:hypothetical protein